MEGHDPLSILLVEDDEAARELLAETLALKFPHISFHVAKNGTTGLECFKKHSAAIVITDVNMPGMNGIHMAREIKAINTGIKFILLTAFGEKSTHEATASAGIVIDHYLMKPVDYRGLFAVIEQCLAGFTPLPL